MDDLRETIKARLAETFKNDTQDTVARKLSTTQGNVSKWLNGQVPTTDMLLNIAKAYKVSVDWILGVSDEREIDGVVLEKLSYEQIARIIDRMFELGIIEIPDLEQIKREDTSLNDYSYEDADLDEEDDAPEKYEPRYDSDYIKINEIVKYNTYISRRNFKISQIEFKTSNYLINMILNGNQYILINTDLWQIICDEKYLSESPIIYTINKNELIIYLDDQVLSFKHHNNIIDINALNSRLKYKNNYGQIKNISDAILSYYVFENEISNNLKNINSSFDNNAYLVSKNWIDKWKKYSNYEILKNNLQNLMNYLIYYFEKNKFNYNTLMNLINEMNVYKFKEKKQFENYLKNNGPLVLMNSDCIQYLNNAFLHKYMKYYIGNNQIHFLLENNEKINFKSANNIISLNNIINDNSDKINNFKGKNNYSNHLKQLIKIFYFHKSTNEIIKSSSSTIENSNIYLINKNLINNYKNIFKYQKLKKILEGNQNTKNISYLNFRNYYPIIINELDDDYFHQIEQIKITDEFKDVGDFEELEYKIKFSSEKIIKYITNFEIVDGNIKNFFIQNNIAKEVHFKPCSYIADHGKILIIFNYNEQNFYEIGHFNDNDDFIIEILINEIERENKIHIIKYIYQVGIDHFIKYDAKEPQNIITLNMESKSKSNYFYQIKFFYCKIEVIQKKILNYQNTNENIINNNDDNENNKYIKEIFSILLSIFTFEKKLKNLINENNSQNLLELENIFLLSSNFIIDFKNSILSFDKVASFLEKLNIYQDYNDKEVFRKFIEDENNKFYHNLILNNKKSIGIYNEKNRDYFIFEKKLFITNSQREILYPDNFYILDENIFSKIMKLLNKKFESKEKISFNLYFNHGKIVLKPNQNGIFNKYNNNYFLFLYSLRNENNYIEINYFPEIILLFENIDNRVNFLKELKNINLTDEFSNNNSIFEETYKFKRYLINEINTKEQIKNHMKEFSINNKTNKYLSYLIIIYNENNKIKKEINEAYLQPIGVEKEYYLINRKYMNKLENILYFKEFINDINISKVKDLNLDINLNNNEIINNIKDDFNDFIKKYLIKINEKELNFDNISISIKELLNNEKNKLYFYDDYQIINLKLYNILNQIDKNLSQKIKLIKAIFNDSKICLFFDEKIINTGFLNEENNTLIIENVIYSESIQEVLNIYKIFGIKGYKNMKLYILDKLKNIIFNSNSLKVYIYFLSGNEKTNKNANNLSPKLKVLILLSLFEQKMRDYYKRNKREKVFLMNKDWLFQYQYEKINSLIEKNDKIKTNLNNQTPLNLSIDSNQMNDVISSLDYKELSKIDEYISNLQTDSNIPIEAKKEKLKLKDNKVISVYNNFIMINNEITQIFSKYFSIPFNCDSISYASHIDGDIICINKVGKQYSILFGKYNSEDFSFEIDYIFDFNYNFYLENESKDLMNKKIKEYIKEKTVFNDNNIKDILSPIFGISDIIGYCYKHSSKTNNIYDFDYFDYLSNDNLFKAIRLYFFYREFSDKIKEAKGVEESFYLINSNLMSEIKINYKYKQIKEILDTINFYDKNKKNILAIKNLPDEIIKYFKENNEIKNKYEKNYIEPEIIPIHNFNMQKDFYIYDKFEILEKEIAQNLINGIYGSGNNCLECVIYEGKIVIHYPENFNYNDKYISVIGQLNYENHFVIEYILFYNDFSSFISHEFTIKGNLNKYLSSLQLYENNAPIVDYLYKELGTIIKYSNETPNYNLNSQTIKENEIKKDINDINDNSNTGTNNDEPKDTLNINEEPQNSLNQNYENDININNDVFYDKSTNDKDDEYNLDSKASSPEIKANFIYLPKIGLQNIGATCYMNATLQCFCHIEKFVSFFKYSQQVVNIVKNDKSNLTYSFKLLIEKLWPNDYNETYSQKHYAPEEFKNKISKLNPLFEGVAANDAKDLVNFIIMTLHQELNKASKGNTPTNKNIDQTNKQIMFNYFAQNFISENQSIISDLFYGINCNTTQCCNCNRNIYNYQIYFFLVFPLEEIRKFKNNNFLNNPVNIYDCFDYDRKVNLMFGENSMYCNLCKQNTNCKMCTCLTTGPEILILLLNRGHGIEFNVKINFPEELNLSNYIEYNNTGCTYKLIGVITHIGESGMGGHFISYCKGPISESWYKYNDAIVSEVQDFQNEVINFAMPYLLFYKVFL